MPGFKPGQTIVAVRGSPAWWCWMYRASVMPASAAVGTEYGERAVIAVPPLPSPSSWVCVANAGVAVI